MRRILAVAVVAAAVAAVVGAFLFEPWRLFTDSTIDESVPSSSAASGLTTEAASESPTTAEVSPAAAKDEVLAEGTFEDAEHGTDGTARILQLADGRRFVRLVGLATSDGPDLHVWLSDRPSGGEWGSYDDGRYVRLGELKANNGNQNYEIPAAAAIDGMTSVVIWCDRFNVAFGTAPVRL